jgi:hypothetical protein
MENMDESKMYISPSKESIMAYVDGEWKQFLRSDVIQRILEKNCNKPAVMVSEAEYCDCEHPTLGKSLSRCGTCDRWFKPIT